jgi:hypothetical protein
MRLNLDTSAEREDLRDQPACDDYAVDVRRRLCLLYHICLKRATIGGHRYTEFAAEPLCLTVGDQSLTPTGIELEWAE